MRGGRQDDWQGVALQYALALAAVALAIGLRLLLDPVLGSQFVVSATLCAVIVAAWAGGLGPALLAVGAGALGIGVFLLEPRGAFSIRSAQEAYGLVLFVAAGLGIALLGGSSHRQLQRANALAERNALKAALIDNSFEAVLSWDLDGRILFWNAAAERLYGYPAAEALGRQRQTLLHADAGVDLVGFMAALRRDGRYEGELLHRARDGRTLQVETRMALVEGAGATPHVIEANRDASARHEAQAALERTHQALEEMVRERTAELAASAELLRASEAGLANIIHSAMDAIVTVDARQRIVLFNAAAEQMFGRAAAQVVGQPLELLIPARFRAEHGRHVDDFGRKGVTARSMRTLGTLAGLRANGEEFPIEASISQTTAEDEKLYTVIVRDMTARLRAEEMALELRLSEERIRAAEEESRMKSEMMATLSHELRTPLNAIVGYTGMLLMKLPGPLNEKQERQLQQIKASADHHLALIDDLLEVARVESGKWQPESAPLVCQDVVDKVVRKLRPLAQAKGLQLDAHTPDGLASLRSDASAIGTILEKLAGNAVKFTAEGSVTISVSQDHADGRVLTRISVADTGPGIGADDQARLFRAFGQVDASSTRRHGGLGLGLHLSGKLAERLGGRIEVHSEPGHGSEFTLQLEQPAAP